MIGAFSMIVKTDCETDGAIHSTTCSYVRTRQLGENTRRRPEIIDNKRTYNSVVSGKIRQLLRRGPDKRRGPYTP